MRHGQDRSAPAGRRTRICSALWIVMMASAMGCGPMRGEALWRSRTPAGGRLWIEDRGQPWMDASARTAEKYMTDWCRGPHVVDWEGFVESGGGTAYQERTDITDSGEVRSGSVGPAGPMVWEIRFSCRNAARSAPAPAPPPAPSTGSPAAPCCKPAS